GAVLAGVLLFGTIGGVALAADSEGGGFKANCGDFITKVCDKYDEYTGESIDRDALQTAIGDVRTQMAEERAEMRLAAGDRPEMNPEAMKEHLDALLSEEKITQEQYDQMIERLESMPEDFPMGFGFRGRGGHGGFLGPCAPVE
ncbi:hypothetical protein ACFLYR_04155, partial [Chloroflexota bacterium]